MAAFRQALQQNGFIWRIYLEEAIKTGPSYPGAVHDWAITFGPEG